MEFQLTNTEQFSLIDAEDLPRILQHSANWSVIYDKKPGLPAVPRGIAAYSKIYGKTVLLSRVIANYFGRELQVDHKDRNIFNNQKENLRLVHNKYNQVNKAKRKNAASKYKGVYYKPHSSKSKPWRVEVGFNGQRFNGGGFDNEISAAVKANELMMKHHGDYAVLNVIPPESI